MLENIGYVVYTLANEGGLTAVWSYADKDGNLTYGTGKATLIRRGSEPFVGEYTVVYIDQCDTSSEFHLSISSIDENTYKLEWSSDEQIVLNGIGGIVDYKLSAGWHPASA